MFGKKYGTENKVEEQLTLGKKILAIYNSKGNLESYTIDDSIKKNITKKIFYYDTLNRFVRLSIIIGNKEERNVETYYYDSIGRWIETKYYDSLNNYSYSDYRTYNKPNTIIEYETKGMIGPREFEKFITVNSYAKDTNTIITYIANGMSIYNIKTITKNGDVTYEVSERFNIKD